MTNDNLSELMAALAPEGEDSLLALDVPEERLREILADLANRPVPVHALHRLWSLGELSAQVAMAYGALWLRQWFADAETRKRRQMETNLRIALRLFHRLAYLRGALTKLGQAAGNFPQIIPAEIAEMLDRLHFQAPPMHYSLIREVVANEFGKEPEELFATFEKEAFAAASLGQVHRARLRTGEEVAVKIQYPGIARTIDADFRNLGALLFPLRLSSDWDYVKGQFEEIRRMLRQEVDYRQEAASLRQARALFEPEDGIVVPQVYGDYSSERVLTTEFVRGRHLNDFLATNPTQALRDHFGTAMYRAHFRLYYGYMNYGDPHPGNYLFLEDGRLGLLDFGCIQYYGAEERELLALCERWIGNDETVLPRVMELASGLRPGDAAYPTYLAMFQRSRQWMMEPMGGGPYDFGDEGHLKRGLQWFGEVLRDRTVRAHPMYVYHHRSVFGLKALVYRLRSRIDVRAMHTEESAKWRARSGQ